MSRARRVAAFRGRPAGDPSVPDEAARICVNQAACDFVSTNVTACSLSCRMRAGPL